MYKEMIEVFKYLAIEFKKITNSKVGIELVADKDKVVKNALSHLKTIKAIPNETFEDGVRVLKFASIADDGHTFVYLKFYFRFGEYVDKVVMVKNERLTRYVMEKDGRYYVDRYLKKMPNGLRDDIEAICGKKLK